MQADLRDAGAARALADEATREHFAATTPLRRLGSADDVVQAVRYLLEGGDYVTGTTLVVDGGRLIR